MPEAPESPNAPQQPAIERFFLSQRFARLKLGTLQLIGYSVAGEETVVQAPELGVCFDIGRSPHFALTSDIVCISHGHMDHVAGLGYYLSQRVFQGMSAGTLLVPRLLQRPVENLLAAWRQLERQETPSRVIAMEPEQVHVVRRDFIIRAIATHHGSGSLGYSLVSVREKLKPEFIGKTSPELVKLKQQGVEIQYRLEVPLVTYLGDTAVAPPPHERCSRSVFEHPDVINAQVLLTECTFFEEEHRTRAKQGKHLHVDELVPLLPTLNCRHVVLLHVSRRTGLRRARAMLRKRVRAEDLARIVFLMDFEGAASAGDVEDAGPPPVED
jgi:ribonuclease Z